MKKTLWILCLVLIIIFSLPANQIHIETLKSDYTNSNTILFKQHLKENNDFKLPFSDINNANRPKSDPKHRTRRKKGKIIFANPVHLQSESRNDFKTKK